VGAMAAVLVSERRRCTTPRARAQRLASVLLVTVSLFPCVSASDDVISFGYVSAGLETRSGFGHPVPDHSDSNAAIYLALQNLEHLQITAFYTLLVAFASLVSCPTARPEACCANCLPSSAGVRPRTHSPAKTIDF